jgi:hypothetical protein
MILIYESSALVGTFHFWTALSNTSSKDTVRLNLLDMQPILESGRLDGDCHSIFAANSTGGPIKNH